MSEKQNRRSESMENAKQSSLLNYAIISFFAAAALSLCIWSLFTTNSFTLLSEYRHCRTPNSTSEVRVHGDELEIALSKASMANKTVIIAMINKAYADQTDNVEAESTMLDLFVDSFWLGEDTRPLLDHVLFVAVDRTAYDRCSYMKLNCLRFETEDADFREEKLYMSSDFINMMWRRTWFLLEVLKRGYSFIFTDTDVLWLRNPMKKLSKNPNEDFQISTDFFNGNSRSEKNSINTGFYLVRSNNKTISLFEKWYNSKDSSKGMKEQDVLLLILRRGIIPQLRLQVSFLDTIHFSGFCQDSTDVMSVATVHANCCRSISAKLSDLRNVLRDWKKFRKMQAALGVNATQIATTFRWTRHRECSNSWKMKIINNNNSNNNNSNKNDTKRS